MGVEQSATFIFACIFSFFIGGVVTSMWIGRFPWEKEVEEDSREVKKS